jgi:FkbM family methyltransferase
MTRKLINIIVFYLFGWKPSQTFWDKILGYKWRGFFLGLIRYRAIYMVKSGETVILGGVFSDEYVKDYANIVGTNGKIVVVEANPENIKRLKKKCNMLKQVTFLNKALWHKKGKTSFLLASAEQAQGYNRIDDETIAKFPENLVNEVKQITIDTCSLNDIRSEMKLDTVHQINLTINGAELRALDSFDQIQKLNPNVRIYINAQYPKPGISVIKKLKEQRFNCFTSRLITTTNKKIKLIRIYGYRQ